ncbi:hypothetical protein VHEMI10138 [[Torrubiella] hemipterigena]|uniref:Major facilitator superfamily (MFS) profile domain-containing protein n=1 Tax=[Torrubiella] hemipterigena TaxID=1531966 RepID=A0A0A1TI14_9HYPO|nr:hypothetical protein VHEMI10138 [[Torrubiella] hemipterigena]
MWPENWRSSTAFVTFTVAFAMMTDTITYDMVIPFLPDLFAKRLHVPEDEIVAWLSLSLEAYGAAMLITNYIAGYIIDTISSKSRPFMVGVAALLASTLLFFLSKTPLLIITSRVLQGSSCALVWTSGLAFLTSSIGEGDVGYYTGYALMGATVGELVGPLIGGFIYKYLGHWAVFTVVEILIFFDIILRLFARDPIAASQPKSSDTEQGPDSSSRSHVETDPLLEGDLLNTQQSTEDAGSKDGDVASAMRRIRLLLATQLTAVLVATMMRCAMETAIPLVVHSFFGWSSDAAGGLMFALLLPTTLSPWAGHLATSYGPGFISVSTCIICSSVVACLGYLTQDTLYTKVAFAVLLSVVGVCLTMTTAVNTTGILILVKKLEDGSMQSTSHVNDENSKTSPPRPWPTEGMIMTGLSTSWALGLILGPACAGLIEFIDVRGWAGLCWALAGISVVAFVCSIMTWKKWYRNNKE